MFDLEKNYGSVIEKKKKKSTVADVNRSRFGDHFAKSES